MTRPHPIQHVRPDQRFEDQLRKLPAELQAAVKQAVKDLVLDPHPKRYRLEKQTKDIWTIHVTSNHSHKLSFTLEGDTAVLRRIGTHKEIDRAP